MINPITITITILSRHTCSWTTVLRAGKTEKRQCMQCAPALAPAVEVVITLIAISIGHHLHEE
ncbi:hypothetical protein BDQ94DRAFT_154060 [Aspergillus welwitschiae]|uniref:Uncharacterized protein n=1 Tax=Aspergillus welwitschiae TaxID=1341132 RepID=A0A3F3PKH8_9EURO|nr:hypothetical protein BDQ94DRAFT_154060 [Aspergillus welwitschiae]RDH27377.1 hypothetical protein BDQ94DRAFT_154060 [Aspergillus welwitschiae]